MPIDGFCEASLLDIICFYRSSDSTGAVSVWVGVVGDGTICRCRFWVSWLGFAMKIGRNHWQTNINWQSFIIYIIHRFLLQSYTPSNFNQFPPENIPWRTQKPDHLSAMTQVSLDLFESRAQPCCWQRILASIVFSCFLSYILLVSYLPTLLKLT